jgi:polysaccharide biosynthesis/export protein
MKNIRKSLFKFAAVSILLGTTAPVLAQTSEYRITPGETVEINIASIHDLTMRALVQTDGTISLNGVGLMMVAGQTPAAFQHQLEMLLPTKQFRERGADGQIKTFIIAPDDITSSIVIFRPVYVMGDVLTPGAQLYLPNMTARQAVAVAGGYSQIRGKISKGQVDPVDLQRDYEALWADFLKSHYHRARLEAELNGLTEFDLRPPHGSPLPASLASAIAGGELATLKIAIEDGIKEQAYYKAAIQAASDQIDTLTAREKVEASGEKADEQELAKVTQLFKNGNLTNDRVAEIRRSLLLTSSRRLGTLVELMKVRSQSAEYQRHIEKDTNQNKVDLLNDLSNTQILLASYEAKLRAATAKLQLRSVASSSETAGEDLVQPNVLIMRKIGDDWQAVNAASDTEVLPGDVLDVSLCRASEMNSLECPAKEVDPQITNAIANR